MGNSKVEKIDMLDRAFTNFMTVMKIIITRVNLWVLEKSNGRWGNSFLGKKVLLLHSTGFVTGKQRITPLFYLADADKVILVASNAGTDKDPAWLRNLQVDPKVKVNINGKEMRMQAHTAETDEYQLYWPRVTEMFPTWEKIQEKSARKFPIAILEPVL